MADNLDVEEVPSEEPETSKTTKKCSDSSSDSDSVPVVKRKRGRRKVKPIGAGDNLGTQTSIYEEKVSSTLVALRAGKLPDSVKNLASTDSDVEDTSPEEFMPKAKRKPKPSQSQLSSAILSSDEGRILLSDDEDVSYLGTESPVTVIDTRSVNRSPSPPPPPVNMYVHQPRASRADQKAIRKLEKAKLNFAVHQMVSSLSNPLNDSATDISIVESPQASDREMTVKVRSRSGVQRFRMKMNECFGRILQEMSAHEGVKIEQATMYLKDESIDPSDTPMSINLHIADIIEFHIQKIDANLTPSKQTYVDKNLVRIKMQGKSKGSMEMMSINKFVPLEKVMREYASKKGVDYQKLKFEFDGESVKATDTVDSLDMEDEDCIDVIGI